MFRRDALDHPLERVGNPEMNILRWVFEEPFQRMCRELAANPTRLRDPQLSTGLFDCLPHDERTVA
jgi:hypothetical protein